jgi:hypothetical protein
MVVFRVKKNGRVVSERVLEDFPVVIGRDAKADILLLNDTVSKEHARIEIGDDGIIRIIDLDSLNGMYADGQRVKEVIIDHEADVFIGQVEVEVTALRDLQTQELQAADLQNLSAKNKFPPQLSWVAAIVGVMSIWTILQKSTFNVTEFSWLDLVNAVFLNSGIYLLCTLFIFVFIKTINRKLNFLAILKRSLAVILLAMVINGFEYSFYYLGNEHLQNIVEWVLGALFVAFIIVVMIFAPLGLVMNKKRLTLFGLGSYCGALLVMTVIFVNTHKSEGGLKDTRIQTPIFGWAGPSKSSEKLFLLVTEMHKDTIAMARKKRQKSDKASQ